MREEYFIFTPSFLREHSFADDRQIRAKQEIHAKHRRNPKTIVEHVLDHLSLTGSERVLDLGCGNGFFLRRIAKLLSNDGVAVGLDIAPGVLKSARILLEGEKLCAQLMVGSADDLSWFKDASFDRILAAYMMHYVPDIEGALREVRRVLRPGGIFLLATDSINTMPEMYETHFAIMEELDFPKRVFKKSPKGRFCMENGGKYLEKLFEQIRVEPYEDELRFEAEEPFMYFYTVGHCFCGAAAEPSKDIPPQMFVKLYARMKKQVEETIACEGAFTVTKHSGCFICR